MGVMQTGPLGPVFFIAILGILLLPARSPAQTIEEKAQLCAACHGENGIPQEKTTPVIWGQYQGYLYLELRDYKSGARKNDIMSPLAETLSRDDMMALALYFSQKRWPDLQQPRRRRMSRPGRSARTARSGVPAATRANTRAKAPSPACRPIPGISPADDAGLPHARPRQQSRHDRSDAGDLGGDIAALAQYMAGLQYLPGQ